METGIGNGVIGMVKRICPGCHKPFHSANAAEDWDCPECGAKIPAPNKAQAQGGDCPRDPE